LGEVWHHLAQARLGVTLNRQFDGLLTPRPSGPKTGLPEETGITTDVAIHQGQKLVLGKVRIGPPDDSVNIFLILTVKVR
jgi:hypothetical protein